MTNGVVVCALDEWARETGVAEVACDLAERYDAPLLYVHVVPPRHGAGDLETARALLDGATAAWAPSRGAAATVESGHPADRVVEVALVQEASFVVLGCHGPRSSLLGSISADVARRAPCPVVVVPSTAAPAVTGGPARQREVAS